MNKTEIHLGQSRSKMTRMFWKGMQWRHHKRYKMEKQKQKQTKNFTSKDTICDFMKELFP